VIAGALVAGEEAPDLRFFALPISDVKVEDTWHVDGMCGTGSHDVVIDEVFVPGEHSVSIAAMSNGTAPGSKLHSGPLYHTPMIPILTQAASMPLLGTAKACVRRFRERSQERFMMYSQTMQSEDVPAQMLVSRSALEVEQAELLMRRVVAEVMELRDEASIEKRSEWGAAYALIVQQSLRIVQELSSASGASAHRLENPLQRALRDLGTAACHVVFDLNAQLKNHGRVKLGLEPSARLF
jgi:alkylation response protein AidB-like acyl-CoA dehydrogenase